MKKDRNGFFQNQSSASYFYPNQNPGMMNNYSYPMMTESNSNFYQGPAMNSNQAIDYNSDLESRISKLERQYNRLESRISKLEGDIPSKDTNYSNNMYMV